jgi:hypothetical protein
MDRSSFKINFQKINNKLYLMAGASNLDLSQEDINLIKIIRPLHFGYSPEQFSCKLIVE